jgi:hypothetical protein
VDPITAIAVASGAVGASAVAATKDVVVKILGPTADYLGDELLQWTQQRHRNVGRIVQNAEEKLGDKINEDGKVPPKVLKEILDDGSFAEDDLAVEYFGGVLASSRSGIARDDRGAAFAKLVAQLTSYQLRGHYCFYTFLKSIHNGSQRSVLESSVRRDLRIFIPFDAYYSAMDFVPEEDWTQILPHTMFGLGELGLIDGTWRFGNAEDIRRDWHRATSGGIIVGPSPLGTELFLWAHGLGNTPVFRFLDKETVLESDIAIAIDPGITSIKVSSDSSNEE